MIRVNLLPLKKGSSARGAPPQASQKWLLAVLGVVVVEVVILFLFHQAKQQELLVLTNENNRLQGAITDIKQLVASHEEVKKALVLLRAREDAIAKLQGARSGPTAVLLELAQILSPGRGPTADPDKVNQLKRDNPNAGYNPSWDVRRLWLINYIEMERTLKIEGLGRDGNDVSEFAQRLKLSSYFTDVTLLPGHKVADSLTGLELVNFSLQMKARY